MNIIAHRGFWSNVGEKNNMTAFQRALDNGFGIETDVREYRGKLVLSHDLADDNSALCRELFDYYSRNNCDSCLALNVKEDGIHSSVKELLKEYKINNFFFFDMSIPEMVVYRRMELPFYTRHSDIETELVLYDYAKGVWVDAFYDDWDEVEASVRHIKDGKAVTMISPEIHGKDEISIWEQIKNTNLCLDESFNLCTDYPQKAKEFFWG